jgi:hypothetical protein
MAAISTLQSSQESTEVIQDRLLQAEASPERPDPPYFLDFASVSSWYSSLTSGFCSAWGALSGLWLEAINDASEVVTVTRKSPS